MQQEDTEREIQVRVNFKLDDVMAHVEAKVNRARVYGRSGDENVWADIRSIIVKERDMALPHDDMWKERADILRNKAVDAIMAKIEPYTRGKLRGNEYTSIIRTIVNAVEQAQKV